MKADATLHPSREMLHACSLGKLEEATSNEILAHLTTCPQCCHEAASCATDSFVEWLRATALQEAPPTAASPYVYSQAPLPAEALYSMLEPPRSADELGRLGPYRILTVLGRGGMGIVFRADDTKLNRHVAIKVMKPDVAADQEARERFLREARAAAAIENDHIIPILHVGEEREVPYIVMPLLRGQTLEDRLKQEPPLSLAETLRIGREIALGLDAAHQRGLVHRDIKPANIWLQTIADSQFRLKILDFGLAHMEEIRTEIADPLTQQGMVMGTPAYMSPEQALGKTADFRSDIYSLGIVLYRLASGKLPFTATTASGYLVAHGRDIPPDLCGVQPTVPAVLGALIMQMLEKEPLRRPASAHELALTLGGLLLPETQPLIPAERASARSRFRGPLLAAGVLFAATLMFVVVWLNRDRTPIGSPDEKNPRVNVNQAVRVKAIRAKHYALVIEDGAEKSIDRGMLGEKSFETRFKDMLEIAVDLSAPAHAYLLAFNPDGIEQLLWPVGANGKPDQNVSPPLQTGLKYPPLEPEVLNLDDHAAGGLQAFVVVVSSEPLPCYREWKKQRSPAAWKHLPAGNGVWNSDGEGVYPMKSGLSERVGVRPLPNAPPLAELCRSLQQGTRKLTIEALAFPVLAKEK